MKTMNLKMQTRGCEGSLFKGVCPMEKELSAPRQQERCPGGRTPTHSGFQILKMRIHLQGERLSHVCCRSSRVKMIAL